MELEEGRALLDADLSWDDRWLAVLVGEIDQSRSIFVVPLDGQDSEPQTWLQAMNERGWIGSPRWSPDGKVLYLLSGRDGFICIWAQALDLESGLGQAEEAFPVVHAHDSSMKMMRIQRDAWRLEVGEGRLVFNASEASGDVYSATLELD